MRQCYEDWLRESGENPEICFHPMLPRLYELLLPTLESRVNFINVGQRYVSLLKYLSRDNVCEHMSLVKEKIDLFDQIVGRLLDINSVLENNEGN